ncbi:hypothetical protein [Lacunimicrobium album]
MNLAAWVLLGLILLTPSLHAQERVVVGFAVAQKAADDDTAVAAEKALRDDLAAAVKFLEEKNYSEFFVRYMPVDQFRVLRNRKDYYELLNKAPKQDMDAFIKEVAIFKDAKVKFGPNNLTATLTVELTAEEVKPITLKAFPALKDSSIGYGNDLKAAIGKAIADLQPLETEPAKAKDAVRFGKSFLPLSEVAYWEGVGWDRYEKSRNTQVPIRVAVPTNKTITNLQMVWKIPVADLEQILKLEPKLEDDGKKAIFTIPNPKLPFPEPERKREIVLELVEGNWRLADSAKPMRAAIQEQMKNQPGVSSNTKTLPMEKMGTTWRFTPQSFR